MHEDGATLTLFFDPDGALTGEAALLEIRLSPAPSGEFEPWRLMPKLPLHAQYARASLVRSQGDAAGAIRSLRQVDTTRRGLSDEFLRAVADVYASLVAEGERYPVKALAASQHVDKSTASRWLSAARNRGLIKEGS